MSERLDAAISYAERGWPVFKLNGKIPPAGSRSFKEATTDERKLRAWWRKGAANIGLATGEAGLLVVDVDPQHGGEKSLRRLEREHGPLPKTVRVRTGGGGEHIYFKNPGDVGNSAGKLGRGIDVRGDGGYVVLPPSTHKSGNRYEWIESPKEVEIAEAPDWLIELCDRTEERVSDWEPTGRKPSRKVLALLDDGDWPMGEQREIAERCTRALLNEGRRTDEVVDQVFDALERSDQDGDDPWLREDIEKLTIDFERNLPPRKREDSDKTKKDDRGPVNVLADSRVDLISLIRDGIPPREYVPGCDPWLVAGKRYLIPAPAGQGKSLIGLVAAIDVVEAGGTAVILDVENGAEEYANRLEDILQARDEDGSLAEACVENLRYHAWPAVNTKWSTDDWAAANSDVDLVIFDSSRFMLTTAGLKENESDDYALFVNALLIPLSRANVATIVLDNTGHEDESRARGTKAKADLNEVVYACKVGTAFDRHLRGEARLIRTRTRFADLPMELKVPLGDGVYGPLSLVDQIAERNEKEDRKQEKTRYAVMLAIQKKPGINARELRSTIKKRSATVIDRAIAELIEAGRVRVESGPRGANLHFPVKSQDDDR